MKKQLGALGLMLCSAPLVSGASVVYVGDFEDPPFDDPLFGEIAGTDGWVIDNTTTDLSFVVASWDPDGAGPAAATQAGGLGGQFVSGGAPGSEVNLSHPVSIPLTSLNFSVDFAVISPLFEPGQDSYGFSFSAGSDVVLRVAFEPPGGNGDLEIAWYDNLGARNLIMPLSQDIFYDGTYRLDLQFTPAGPDAGFSAIISGTNTFMFAGTLTGEGASTLTSVGVDYDVVDDGDSFIIFDNLAAIPEPQSALLLGFGALACLARRRRR